MLRYSTNGEEGCEEVMDLLLVNLMLKIVICYRGARRVFVGGCLA